MSDATQANLFLVADVGSTYVRAALARDGQLGPIVRHRIADLSRHPESGIVDGIIEALRAVRGPERIAAVGIGICTVVDGAGVLQRSPAFGVPSGPYLRDLIAGAFGVPVAVDNDANLAALGELGYGAGRGLDTFVVVTLGTFIGMGIIANGEILRGGSGGAGEVGELLVPVEDLEPTGDGESRLVKSARFGSGISRGPAGYAWIEELVGGAALSRALAGQAGALPTQPRYVLREASGGNEAARAILEHGLEGWAYAITGATTMLDPEAIFLSGGLSTDVEPFLDALCDRVYALSRSRPDIRIAELGVAGGLVGAQVAATRLARDPSSG
jgi:predicted NBD/HSP70 family sugar kinase